METLSSNTLNRGLKRFQMMRRGFTLFQGSGTNRRNVSTVRLGGGGRHRPWLIRLVPKLRFKVVLSSSLRLSGKLKNGYVNMMLNLAGNKKNVFGGKRVPKGRQLPVAYSRSEFDDRLLLEVYKSLVASRELATST